MPPVALVRALRWLPPVAVTVLMLVAMTDMLVGVVLRYVVTWVSARFDLPSVRFFWVEEIGEYSLAWLTFIGAAVGIRRGTHFAVHIVTERFPAGLRRAVVADLSGSCEGQFVECGSDLHGRCSRTYPSRTSFWTKSDD